MTKSQAVHRKPARRARPVAATIVADNRQALSKLDQLVAHLTRPEGATIADMMTLTGWQAHSVRGALAGALKKRGHVVVSDKSEGVRTYRIGADA